jgi:hypothetical protein
MGMKVQETFLVHFVRRDHLDLEAALQQAGLAR